MSSPAAIYEVCVPDVFHGIVPVRGLKTIFRRIDGSLIMELNNRFMNKRLFPFLFQLSSRLLLCQLTSLATSRR